MEATQKQLEFIKIIEEYVCEKFTGKTRGDASVWISRHYDEYNKARKKENEEMNENTWAIEHGYY